ncbi:hypothetical protein RD792_002608 [Penstemon davidsonii]|uniref:NAC domain-containing protein n=1 Tax=Penstemon davidsonii TaxID=160366 RepID=A0ABR0DSI9_9LAMI|nr:hypothetical protein RD792_002608 [Penstemon davidsonii]
MSSLSTVEKKLPPGFRFHPRDDELICDYLMKWMAGFPNQSPLLIEVDLNKCEPWDIPESAFVGNKEWYFYSQKDRKYATGQRTNRATVSGYWKATGKDRPITRKGTLVGMRKTLVFYQGRAPKGRKTEWVMHEFRLEGIVGPGPKLTSPVKEDWVLCRVFYKNRSEVIASKQEPDFSSNETCYNYSQSLPTLLIEPCYNITFDDNNTNNNQYHQVQPQVPCFSIFNTNQTSPTFSLLTHMNHSNFGGTLPEDLGIYNSQSLNSSSSCDTKVIKAVLSQLGQMGSGNNNNHPSMKASSSFGEGSSDSYLSEVGLSSMWNHYS